jgi:DNA mismatch repair ATPase MutL
LVEESNLISVLREKLEDIFEPCPSEYKVQTLQQGLSLTTEEDPLEIESLPSTLSDTIVSTELSNQESIRENGDKEGEPNSSDCDTSLVIPKGPTNSSLSLKTSFQIENAVHSHQALEPSDTFPGETDVNSDTVSAMLKQDDDTDASFTDSPYHTPQPSEPSTTESPSGDADEPILHSQRNKRSFGQMIQEATHIPSKSITRDSDSSSSFRNSATFGHSTSCRTDMKYLVDQFTKFKARPSQAHALKSLTCPNEVNAEEELTRTITKSDFATMNVIGQFNLGFIVAHMKHKNTNDLYIIDQHAADEKYNYEKLKKETKIHTQPLVW